MMADAKLNIDLPGVNFEQMAREAISVKLTEALIGSDDAIMKIVVAAMSQKVSERGHVSNSSYENKTPFVEWLAQDLIRGAALNVVKAKVETLRPAIEKAVEAALNKNTKSIARTLTESFISSCKSGYGVKIELAASFNEPR